MKKRILTLVLVLLMVATIATPAMAGQVVSGESMNVDHLQFARTLSTRMVSRSDGMFVGHWTTGFSGNHVISELRIPSSSCVHSIHDGRASTENGNGDNHTSGWVHRNTLASSNIRSTISGNQSFWNSR